MLLMCKFLPFMFPSCFRWLIDYMIDGIWSNYIKIWSSWLTWLVYYQMFASINIILFMIKIVRKVLFLFIWKGWHWNKIKVCWIVDVIFIFIQIHIKSQNTKIASRVANDYVIYTTLWLLYVVICQIGCLWTITFPNDH